MKKNRTRVGAFLLAMVMLFGMLPLSSMAAYIGSGTGSEVVPPFQSTTDVNPAYAAIWGQFTRFTLVKFNMGYNSPDISKLSKLDESTVEVLGFLDVSSNRGSTNSNGYGDGVSQDEANWVIDWWRTDALTYLTKSKGDVNGLMSYFNGAKETDASGVARCNNGNKRSFRGAGIEKRRVLLSGLRVRALSVWRVGIEIETQTTQPSKKIRGQAMACPFIFCCDGMAEKYTVSHSVSGPGGLYLIKVG